ncbi:site-specific tyrosine recombinase XerD [Desertihabitans aurantiacus]|uniref:site-specific tyrosine recombinase XerD n=1 Tax=Desertihabitans aurantiacus TaxID=2282477 RepID=UPI0018E5789F|nr:site-specific tyrosine recombinase XerD [Desertihabitans aurantiacus]
MRRFVQGFLDHLAVERGMSTHTVQGYRRDLERYLHHLTRRGLTRPEDVDAEAVTGFAHALQTGGVDEQGGTRPPLARASVARAVVAVRSLHRFGVEERLTPDNPAAAVHPPGQGRRLPKALPLDQVQALLDAPDRSTPVGLRDAALLELLYGTGARISEITALDVDDVSRLVDADANPHQGLRLIGKGDKERVVPLGSYARRAVSDWLVRGRPTLAGGDPALLLNARGRRLSRQSAWAVLRGAAARAGLDAEVSPHTLRHSFATHLLDGGADVRVVQELLGHASVTTTQVYTLVTVDHLREVYLSAHPRSR